MIAAVAAPDCHLQTLKLLGVTTTTSASCLTFTVVSLLGVYTKFRQGLLYMNNSSLQSGMLLMSEKEEKGVSLILPVRLLLDAMTSCTMSASARKSSGASSRIAVAQRLRHATSTAQA
jgi:hypothetical protein